MTDSPDGPLIHQYPKDIGPDYVMITSHKFRSRPTRVGNARDNLIGDPGALPPVVNHFKLPVPDLPNMISSQKFGTIEGALNNALATAGGEAYSAIDSSITAGKGLDQGQVGEIANRLKAQVTDAGGSVIREMAAGLAGKMVGINAIQFQTLATGSVTNPNIELLYAGPTLRTFAMNWTFAPKSSEEAQGCYDLIKALKQDQLPSSSGGGMLEVPHVFKVKLYIQGKEAEFYQKYMTCALESIGVNQDAQGSHMTLPNGAPVVSSLSCVFKELKIITREDMENNI